MKKFKFLVANIFAGTFVFLGGAISPFLAFAESAENGANSTDSYTAEESVEEESSGVNWGDRIIVGETYVKEVHGSRTEITILDNTTVLMDIYINGNYIGAAKYTYMPTGENVITLLNGQYVFDEILLNANGTYDSYNKDLFPETSEEPEPKPELEPKPEPEPDNPIDETASASDNEELTFEDILAFVSLISKETNFSNAWEKAFYYIKTAASAEKVDAMIYMNAGSCVAYIAVTVVMAVAIIKSKKSKVEEQESIKNNFNLINIDNDAQKKAINSLIEEEAKVESKVGEIESEVKANALREKALAESIAKQNIAIRSLIRGTNIKQDLKDEAFRALNESDDLSDIAKK